MRCYRCEFDVEGGQGGGEREFSGFRNRPEGEICLSNSLDHMNGIADALFCQTDPGVTESSHEFHISAAQSKNVTGGRRTATAKFHRFRFLDIDRRNIATLASISHSKFQTYLAHQIYLSPAPGVLAMSVQSPLLMRWNSEISLHRVNSMGKIGVLRRFGL